MKSQFVFIIFFLILFSCDSNYGVIETEQEFKNLEDLCFYVSNSIESFDDICNYFQSPKETEEYRLGDCEDYTLYFMFLCNQELAIKPDMIIVYSYSLETYHAIAFYNNYYYDCALNCIYAKLPVKYRYVWTWPYDIIMFYATAGYTKEVKFEYP